MDDIEIDVKKLRYVLYARKSTTDEARQVRSITDQITECRQLATRQGLKVIGKPLTESESAKKPGRRPVFRQMLDDIKKGKYDAILAWNPDRLSRNMVEAGEIIDMVDNNIIKDLKFCTHPFSRDANGVMLLGLSFVLSKQYSDDLSQKSKRGTRHNFEEGKSPVPKHGYIRDDDGLYRPDGENFELIKKAWEMRRSGDSLDKIADFMNKNGYYRLVKSSGRKVSMHAKILTDLFHDPFYFGKLVQAGNTVDLRTIYNFEAATTETVYNEVQQLSAGKLKPFNTKQAFYPFRSFLRCSYCDKNMVVAPSTSSSGKKLLYARCDTERCKRPKKSIRVKHMLDFVYEFLDKGLNFTEKDYNEYYGNLKQITEAKQERITIDIHSRQGRLTAIEGEINERALGIGRNKMSYTARDINEKRITELQIQKQDLQDDIDNLKKQIANPDSDKLSLEQFLNLSKNAATIIKSANPVVKDVICKKIFLNLTLDEAKVLS